MLNLDEEGNPHTYVREGGAEVLRLGEGEGEEDRSATADLDHPTTEQVSQCIVCTILIVLRPIIYT